MNDSSISPPPSSSYKVTLGTDPSTNACQNSTSPICFNTVVSGQNIITGLWFNAIIGLFMLGLFIAWRGTFSFYQARLESPYVVKKPPRMKLTGHHRIWSWLVPVFKVSDEELVWSAGLDALVATRIIGFGLTLFAPMAVLAVAVLLPINYMDDYFESSAESDNLTDVFTTVFVRLTISNVVPRSPVMWVHFAMVYVFCGWTCWLTVEYYKEYIAIRQAYMVQATETAGEGDKGEGDAADVSLTLLSRSKRGDHVELDVDQVPRAITLAPPASNRLRLPGRTATGSFLGGRRREPSPLGRHITVGGVLGAQPEALALKELELGSLREVAPVSDALSPRTLIASPRALGAALLEGPGRVRRALMPPQRAWTVSDDEGRQLLVGHGGGLSSGGTGTGGEDDSGGSSPFAVGSLDDPGVRGGGTAEVEPLSLRDKYAARPERLSGHPGDGELGGSAAGTRRGAGPGPAGDGRVSSATSPRAATPAAAAPAQPAPPRPPSPPKGGGRHSRAGSHAAAVAAALDVGQGSNAREALRHIRHVRARSGASADGATPGVDAVFAMFAVTAEGAGGTRPGTPGTSRPPSVLGEAEPLSPAPTGLDLEGTSAQAMHAVSCWWHPPDDAPASAADSGADSGAAARDHLPSSGPGRRASLERCTSTAGGAPPRLHRASASNQASNASLLTVLVTDAPVEKLRLLRLGVFSFAGSGGGTSRLGAATGANGGGDPGAVRPMEAYNAAQEDMADALNAVENGQWDMMLSPGAQQADQSAHRSWIHRWILQLVRRDQSYTEWRRDVQWAMFNKRVRVATELFSELFGDDFDAIIPIYPTKVVDYLIHKWDSRQATLERAEYELQHGKLKPAKLEKVRKKITKLKASLQKLQNKIEEEREEVLSDLPSTCFFATFRSQQAAAIAAQTNLNPIMQRLFKVEPAPRPDDINWTALQRSWWQRTLRPIFVLPGIIIILLIPIGAFTGAFAQLTVALCGNPATGTNTANADSWLCQDGGFPALLRNLITSLGPSILLSLYNMVILPVIIYYLAQAEGQAFSLSSLDRRCADLFFAWDIFNVFLGAMLGGTILGELRTFVTEPAQIWSALGSAIPAASNFFINYISYRAFVMAFFRLFYPSQAVIMSILRWVRIVPASKTERDKTLEMPQRNCRFGRDIGIPIMMNFVMVFGYAVVSPLILPFGLLYFVLLWPVWRYQMLYVFQRQYESGGQFWPYVAHKIVWCQMLMVVFTALVFVVKGAYTQAVVLAVTLPIFLLNFKS